MRPRHLPGVVYRHRAGVAGVRDALSRIRHRREGEGHGVDGFELEIGGEVVAVISLPAVNPAAAGLELPAAEQEVACDALAGLSNAAIAQKRGRSARTIANQLASIYRKLGVASRAEMMAHLLKASPELD